MEKDKLRKIIVAVISVIVTIGVIAYLSTLPAKGDFFEQPYWIGFLLFLYWIIFINWYAKHKKGKGGD